MSTHSTVARALDNGFEGRYVHGDGYPGYQVVVLLRLVSRHGIETVRRVLLEEHYAWSLLDPHRGAGYLNAMGERAVNVPGWGLAYTDTPLTYDPFGTPQHPYRQATADEWCRHDNDPDVDYAYVLNDDALSVLQNRGDARWDHLGDVPYDTGTTPAAIEQALRQRRPVRELPLAASRPAPRLVAASGEGGPQRWDEALILRWSQ